MKYLYLIAITATVLSCGTKKAPQMLTLELTAAEAIVCDVPNTVEFITQTQPTRSYIIQSRVNGYLRSVNFSNGMPVKRGQLLYTIDQAPFQNQVIEARAALAAAKANLVNAQASYDRSVPLARINAISKSQLDGATASLAAAREHVQSSEALLQNTLLNLGYCRIMAPEGGIIAPSSANVGDYVGAGTAYQTLTTISFDDSISVNLSLPTVEYYKMVSGDRPAYKGDSLLTGITLKLSDGTIYPQKGTYMYTQPLVDDQSGSIVFNVVFPNQQGLLKGGQFARVTASVGKPQQRILIPARAVSEVQGEYGAYVIRKDETLEFRKISVGQTVGSDWIILSGISAGERVITDGLLKAKSGMKIKVKQ